MKVITQLLESEYGQNACYEVNFSHTWDFRFTQQGQWDKKKRLDCWYIRQGVNSYLRWIMYFCGQIRLHMRITLHFYSRCAQG